MKGVKFKIKWCCLLGWKQTSPGSRWSPLQRNP